MFKGKRKKEGKKGVLEPYDGVTYVAPPPSTWTHTYAPTEEEEREREREGKRETRKSNRGQK